LMKQTQQNGQLRRARGPQIDATTKRVHQSRRARRLLEAAIKQTRIKGWPIEKRKRSWPIKATKQKRAN